MFKTDTLDPQRLYGAYSNFQQTKNSLLLNN